MSPSNESNNFSPFFRLLSGVLDPVELSILSGSVSESTKSFLSRVNEGEPSPSPGSCGRGDTFSKSESSPQGNSPLPMVSSPKVSTIICSGFMETFQGPAYFL